MKTTFRHTQATSTRQTKARQELRASTFVNIIKLLLGM